MQRKLGTNPISQRERFRGCLLAGAVGDALGAPVEFMGEHELRQRFGPKGVTEFLPAYGRIGAITDDTQMTLFTAEGMMRGSARWHDRGLCSIPRVLHRAYLRWLKTQGVEQAQMDVYELDLCEAWLSQHSELHHRRAPGNTCLSALRSGYAGSHKKPINNSKGCGGVMRVAPIGLARPTDAFEIGVEAAALTHGHPNGFLAAGFLAELISALCKGAGLIQGAAHARGVLVAWEGHEEVLHALNRAVSLAKTKGKTASVSMLGQGWVAEEAMAISLFCALTADSLEDGVVRAVSHGGDSDSTGAITGNILGALFGEDAIPRRWLEQLELGSVIEQVADDLYDVFTTDDPWSTNAGLSERYPPN
jgi:ADP-ribosylglycohydrolase